jgi:3-oxoacyl-[acyl-carrier-protein] synthase-3
MTKNGYIIDIETHLPSTILTNEELAKEFPDWPAEKILSKTGIKERRISSKNECASDLAVVASEKLLAKHDRNKIEFLIFCTQSPEYLLPTNACLIQDRLKLPVTCGALDINLGCSGFVYGLGLTKSLIESGQVENVLLLNADTYTKYINPKDKSVRTLFGDAATATLVSSEKGIAKLTGPFVYGTDGRGKDNLIVKTRGLRNDYISDAKIESDNSGNARTVNDLYMNGAEIFSFTSFSVPTLIRDTLKKANLSMENIDLFIFHQANVFILNHLRKLLFIDKDKMAISMENTGNTVSCTIPIALKDMMEKGKLKEGYNIMLVGFGVGYSWGATIIKWT